MGIAEATRQYQIALEHERTVRDRSYDLLTFEDDRVDAWTARGAALRELDVAWLEYVLSCRR